MRRRSTSALDRHGAPIAEGPVEVRPPPGGRCRAGGVKALCRGECRRCMKMTNVFVGRTTSSSRSTSAQGTAESNTQHGSIFLNCRDSALHQQGVTKFSPVLVDDRLPDRRCAASELVVRSLLAEVGDEPRHPDMRRRPHARTVRKLHALQCCAKRDQTTPSVRAPHVPVGAPGNGTTAAPGIAPRRSARRVRLDRSLPPVSPRPCPGV